jgi:hypothetical protein
LFVYISGTFSDREDLSHHRELPMLNISRFLSPSFSAKGSTFNPRRRWLSVAKSTLGVAMAMGALAAGQARAVIVNVEGQDWDVTTFTGTYNDNPSKFATAANGGVMPWWGNSSLANDFASVVLSSLGYWNPIDDNPDQGPNFAFGYDNTHHAPTLPGWGWNGNFNLVMSSGYRISDNVVWAQAAPASPAAVPGPLPALGAAAAFGFSRKLRKRIKINTCRSATFTLF